MKRYLIILIFSFLFSCNEAEEKAPYIWSEDRFTEVLTEFQQAEAIVRLGYHRTKDSLILNDSIYNAAFRKMNVTKAEFDSNYNYYLKHPKVLEKIYQEVITNLSERSAELKKKNPGKAAKPKQKKKSIDED